MKNLFSVILVGVDDSAPCKVAAALAARLAREYGGRLILCNVVNWLPLVAQLDAATVVDPRPIIEGLKQQGDTLVAETAASAREFGVEAERHVAEGEPSEALLQLAAEQACSLIVMGTHGRRGVGRLFIGSTTEAVLRGSTVPVLTVRPDTRIAPSPRRSFERIVVGVDDSEPSDAAIAMVLALPEEDRPSVAFYSILDTGRVGGAHGYTYPAVLRGLEEAAHHLAEGAVARARAHGFEAQGHVVEGRPDDELVRAVDRAQADLLVVGSHGRRGVRRFFLGSVAEQLARVAPVPVLVVRTAETAG